MQPDSPRRPAYSPLTPNSIRERIAALRSYQQPAATGGGFTWFNGDPYYGGYGFGMFFIGSGFYCDPLGLWTCYSPFGFYPGSSFYLFPNLAFMAPFGMYPCPLSYSPYSSASLFYGSPFSSFFYAGGYFPPCTPAAYDPFSFGLSGANSPLTPLATSVLISNGVMPGLQSASSMASAISGDASAASADAAAQPAGSSNSPTLHAARALSPGEPLTLVFTDGATVRAVEYRLTGNGTLTYVTPAGARFTVPLARLDFAKTLAANGDNGVQFLAPSSGQSPSAPSAQPPAPQPH